MPCPKCGIEHSKSWTCEQARANEEAAGITHCEENAIQEYLAPELWPKDTTPAKKATGLDAIRERYYKRGNKN